MFKLTYKKESYLLPTYNDLIKFIRDLGIHGEIPKEIPIEYETKEFRIIRID